ncbi:threonyl-tRNA synthetase family protein, partial [Toxoplasma gondii ARI]
LDAWKKSQQ